MISNTPFPTSWDPHWLPHAVTMDYEAVASLLHLSAWLCKGENILTHVKQLQLGFLFVCFLLFSWGFLNNLVFKQILSLGRVEGSFPREMGQEKGWFALEVSLVKITRLEVFKTLEEIKQ